MAAKRIRIARASDSSDTAAAGSRPAGTTRQGSSAQAASCPANALSAPDINVIRLCRSRLGSVIYPVCQGRKPPSCADVSFNSSTGWLPSGCGAALSFDECINNTPVFYLTQSAVPGEVYRITLTLFPNSSQTLTRAWLTPNLRPEDPSPAVFSPGDVSVSLAGPGVQTAAGEARQAWTVTVTWTPTAASQIPLGGGGLQLCIQDRRALAYNPYPFASVWLKGTAAAAPTSGAPQLAVAAGTAAAATTAQPAAPGAAGACTGGGRTRAAQRRARRREQRAWRGSAVPGAPTAATGAAGAGQPAGSSDMQQLIEAARSATSEDEFARVIVRAVGAMAQRVAASRAGGRGSVSSRPAIISRVVAPSPASKKSALTTPAALQHAHVARLLGTVANLISRS